MRIVAHVIKSWGAAPYVSYKIIDSKENFVFSYKELSPLVSVLVSGGEPVEQTFVSPPSLEATDEYGSNQPTGFRRVVCWEMYVKDITIKFLKKLGHLK